MVEGKAVKPMTSAAFIAVAPELVAHFAVRPEWGPDELTWLLAMAEQNTVLGTLRILLVTSGDEVDGCFLYYSQANATARVLNILARQGQEKVVLDAMMGYFAQAGYAEARGRALQPFIDGLSVQRWLYFRHKAFTSVLTKHPDVVDAVAAATSSSAASRARIGAASFLTFEATRGQRSHDRLGDPEDPERGSPHRRSVGERGRGARRARGRGHRGRQRLVRPHGRDRVGLSGPGGSTRCGSAAEFAASARNSGSSTATVRSSA